jgi:hypothetical protein
MYDTQSIVKKSFFVGSTGSLQRRPKGPKGKGLKGHTLSATAA